MSLLASVSVVKPRYAAQWKVESLTGRIDPKTSEVAQYTISQLFDNTWQCGCWAWIKWHNADRRPSTFDSNGNCKQAHHLRQGIEP